MCIKHLFNEQTFKINGCTPWFDLHFSRTLCPERCYLEKQNSIKQGRTGNTENNRKDLFFLVVFNCAFQQSITLRSYWNLEFGLFPSSLRRTQVFPLLPSSCWHNVFIVIYEQPMWDNNRRLARRIVNTLKSLAAGV